MTQAWQTIFRNTVLVWQQNIGDFGNLSLQACQMVRFICKRHYKVSTQHMYIILYNLHMFFETDCHCTFRFFKSYEEPKAAVLPSTSSSGSIASLVEKLQNFSGASGKNCQLCKQ